MGYTFHEGPLKPDIVLDFESALFNTPAFAALHDHARPLYFYLLDEKRGKAVAQIRFDFDGKVARSPLRAPFGSVEWAPGLSPGKLFEFIQRIETCLREKGAREMYIKNPPRAYNEPGLSLLEVFLHNLGYTISAAEAGACIPVGEASFRDRMRNSERLRIRQAEKAGVVFRQTDADALDEVYGFIARCYREKGYEVSITGDDLRRAVKDLPGRYLFSVVQRDADMIAAAVSVRVTSEVVYNFLVNHPLAYNHLSPALLLMEGIYDYCVRNRVRLLDLGTSALAGKPNITLLDFKMHTGGHPTSKFTFYKSLA